MHNGLVLITLFGLGLLHGLGPDHCLAIATLAGSGPGRTRRALGVSVRFGVGHTVALASAALASVLLGFVIPAAWEARFEVLGGLVLIGLGAWSLATGKLLLHRHTHHHGTAAHEHLHLHVNGRTHVHETHKRWETAFGALFGMSGVRGLVLVLPLTAGASVSLACLGVLLFGMGVIFSMVTFGVFTALAADLMGRAERAVQVFVAGMALVVGAYWVAAHV